MFLSFKKIVLLRCLGFFKSEWTIPELFLNYLAITYEYSNIFYPKFLEVYDSQTLSQEFWT